MKRLSCEGLEDWANWRFGAILLCFCLFTTSCVRHPRIMSAKEYSRHLYSSPYILHINQSTGSLLYFGVSHTNEPDNPEILQIESQWAQFHPDIAFNEGGDPPIENALIDAIRKFGEPGLLRFLTSRDGIPIASIDPSRAAETSALLREFSPEQVKSFFVLRQVSEYGHINHPTRSLDEQVQVTLANLDAIPGLNVKPSSVKELEALYSSYFPARGNFRDVPSSWFDPTRSDTFLNKISIQDNLYRDEYMVNLLTREVKAGKRVFAAVGFTHVVCQEQVLRYRMEREPFRH